MPRSDHRKQPFRHFVWFLSILFTALGSLSATALDFPRDGYVTIITDEADPDLAPCRDILRVGYQQDGANSYFAVTVNCTDVGFNNQRFMLYFDADGDGVNDRLLWMENPQVTRLYAWDGTQWQDTDSPTADFLDPDLSPDDTVFLGVATGELGLTAGQVTGVSTATANVRLDPTCNEPGCQGAGDTTGEGGVGVANLSVSPEVLCSSEALTASAVRLDTRALSATFSWYRPDGTLAASSGPVPFLDGTAQDSHAPAGPEGYWRVEVSYFGEAGVSLPNGDSPETDALFARVNQVVAEAGSPASVCPGGGVRLGGSPSAEGGSPPYEFAWLPEEGLDNPSSPNPVASPASTTTYTLTVVGTQGCLATDSVTVTVAPCNPALLRFAPEPGETPRSLDPALDTEANPFASGDAFSSASTDLAPGGRPLVFYGIDLAVDTLRVSKGAGRVVVTY